MKSRQLKLTKNCVQQIDETVLSVVNLSPNHKTKTIDLVVGTISNEIARE